MIRHTTSQVETRRWVLDADSVETAIREYIASRLPDGMKDAKITVDLGYSEIRCATATAETKKETGWESEYLKDLGAAI